MNLEENISVWRQRMLAAGIQTPVPLEELELHLREDIEQQMASGLNPQQAFENSVQKMGNADELKGEFKRFGGMKHFPQLSQWSLFRTGASLLAITALFNMATRLILNLSKPLAHGSSTLAFLPPPTYWLPCYVMLATFTISGLIIGFGRWHAKWFWVAGIGLIGTMMVNLFCIFVLHRRDSGFFSADGSLIRWGWLYMTWLLFILVSLFRGRFSGFVTRKRLRT
jgi:hypothetical protein